MFRNKFDSRTSVPATLPVLKWDSNTVMVFQSFKVFLLSSLIQAWRFVNCYWHKFWPIGMCDDIDGKVELQYTMARISNYLGIT